MTGFTPSDAAPMSTCQWYSGIPAFLDGELAAAEAEQLEGHLPDCASCRAELRKQRQMLCLLESEFTSCSDEFELPLPKDFTRRLTTYARTDMRGLRQRSEFKQAAWLIIAPLAVAGVVLGGAYFTTLWRLAGRTLAAFWSLSELVFRFVSDLLSGLALIIKLVSSELWLREGDGAMLVMLGLSSLSLWWLLIQYHRRSRASSH